ncbi:MAG: hypothetical protein IIA20_02425 [Thaumarchaeota archaeon]|nr:hypothetical protein [Nitrososphaerota archaeon]
MVSIDKAAIVLTMAIVAIALGVAASGGATQDASPVVSTPPTVSTETSESEAPSFGADLAAKVKEDTAAKASEDVEKPMISGQTIELEEEISMEETSEPQTIHVEIPTGTSSPGCEETNSCYSPADVTINAGDTVHWMNVDTVAHTVTGGSPADGPSGVFDSSLIMADAVYAFTFEETGSYDYFCMVHPWMTGSVTVN